MKGNNLWDDPEWEALRRRMEKMPSKPHKKLKYKIPSKMRAIPIPVQKTAELPPKTPKNADNTHVSVHIKLPKFSRKRIKTGFAVFGILATSVIAAKVLPGVINKKGTDSGVLSGQATEPEFDTVLPDGKAEETSTGKLGYDAEKKVASFTDTLDTAQITVSQQPLPEKFKADPDSEVKKLAEGFSATETLVESNPTAYIGNDISGAQTVIFHKNGLLIFILSNKSIEKDRWTEYITKLI